MDATVLQNVNVHENNSYCMTKCDCVQLIQTKHTGPKSRPQWRRLLQCGRNFNALACLTLPCSRPDIHRHTLLCPAYLVSCAGHIVTVLSC